jgi:hypothetical protein
MSSKYWVGGAASAQQIDRFTPATVQVGDIFTLTATGEDGSTAAVSFTAAATTVASVTAGLVAAWNASTNPLHTPITAADATTSMTLTADVAGVPFSVASTTTDGGGANTQTLVRSVVTASTGPKDWNTAVNWSDVTVPVSTDTVTLDGRAGNSIIYGLNQSAVTLASFQHYESMRYDVGTNTAPLRISATICDLTRPAIDGSRNTPGKVYLNLGTNADHVHELRRRAQRRRRPAARLRQGGPRVQRRPDLRRQRRHRRPEARRHRQLPDDHRLQRPDESRARLGLQHGDDADRARGGHRDLRRLWRHRPGGGNGPDRGVWRSHVHGPATASR